jgi:hypothetical protein
MVLNLIPGNPELTTCFTSGVDINSCLSTVGAALTTGLKAMGIPISEVPTNQNLTSEVFETLKSNPISGVAYTSNLVAKLSPVTTVKAQTQGGFGFNAESSILVIWRAARNVSYALLVIATIVLAFMIMFRVKLSPQLVISIQSALPKIIVALILITFSYAIAGFLIDLMYVIIGLISLVLSSGGLTGHSPAVLFDDFTKKFSAFGLMYLYWVQLVWMSFDAIFTSGGFSAILGILIFLFSILMIFAVIWWSIKIIFVLIQNFVTILLTIVIGPLEIMLGTIVPGMGFGSWIRRLASSLAVYPVMAVMFFLSFFFLFQGGGTNTSPSSTAGFLGATFAVTKNMISGNLWQPPFLMIGGGPVTGTNKIIWIIVSIGMFSQIAKVSKMIKSAMAGRPLEFESAIGEVVGGAAMVGGAATQYIKGVGDKELPSGSITILKHKIDTQRIANKLRWLSLLRPPK